MKNTIINIFRKNRTILTLGTVAMLSLSACKDSFTELNPLSSLSETTAFSTPATVELAMNGVYWAAGIGQYAGAAGRGYPFGAASIEQAEMRGEDMVNTQAFFAFTYRNEYNTTSANNVNHWEQLYSLINQANVFMNGVRTAGESGVVSAEEATAYEGEARFLRALAHHELLIHFSAPFADGNGSKPGVPYRENAINSSASVAEGLAQGRGTVAETYAKILQDLDYAEQNLPAAHAIRIGRASKVAAIAIKSRVKLHMQDWAGVVIEAAKLGADKAPFASSADMGNYGLEANIEAPFTNQKANKESIFSIANSAASNPGVNGALANFMGSSDNGAREIMATSPNLYNAEFWVDGDLRRERLQYMQKTGSFPFSFCHKYRDFGVNGDWAPIIRYAEVILNAAEANARLGNDAVALEGLNAVRNRAVPTAAQFTSAPADLIQAILNERRIEFTGEGRRWPDIHRLILDDKYTTGGIPGKIEVSQIKNESYDLVNRPMLPPTLIDPLPYSDYRFLWPIPASETQVNDVLRDQQNPGY